MVEDSGSEAAQNIIIGIPNTTLGLIWKLKWDTHFDANGVFRTRAFYEDLAIQFICRSIEVKLYRGLASLDQLLGDIKISRDLFLRPETYRLTHE